MKGLSKRSLVISVAVILAVAVVFIQRRVEHARMWMQAVDHTRVLLDEANARYYAQDARQAVIALTHLLEHLESVTPVTEPWRAPAHPFLNADQLALERALTASRLAIVQERLGQKDAATASWARAESHTRGSNPRLSDAASLRALVERLDEGERESASPAR